MSTSIISRRSGRRRRSMFLASASAIALVFLAACGSPSGNATGDTVPLSGVNGDPTNGASGAPIGSIHIAEGWDERDGYKLDWDVAQSAAAGLQLLANGSIDIAQGSTPNGYAAAHLDDSIKIIGFLNGPSYTLLVPEGSDISKDTDLEGKTIGVLSLGSASHLMARGAVEAAGVNPDDVEYLPVAVGAPMAEALNSEKIDALVGWEGMWQSVSAITDEPLERLETRLTKLYGQMLLVTTDEVIEEKRDTLVAYMRNFYKACALAEDDPERAVADHWEVFDSVAPPASEMDAAVKEHAEWNKDFYSTCTLPSPDTGEVGALSDSELKETYEFFLNSGIIEDEVDLSQVVDQSIVKEALEGVDITNYDS